MVPQPDLGTPVVELDLWLGMHSVKVSMFGKCFYAYFESEREAEEFVEENFKNK